MNLSKIAAIAGKGGLYKIIKPTRNGVIIESLEPNRIRTVAGSSNKVSVLQEITIYTTDAEGSIPLGKVLEAIKAKYAAALPVESKSSSGAELHAFMKEVAPDYDMDKVYTSDIKKLVSWYNLLSANAPEVFEENTETGEESESSPELLAGTESAAAAQADTEAASEKPQL